MRRISEGREFHSSGACRRSSVGATVFHHGLEPNYCSVWWWGCLVCYSRRFLFSVFSFFSFSHFFSSFSF